MSQAKRVDRRQKLPSFEKKNNIVVDFPDMKPKKTGESKKVEVEEKEIDLFSRPIVKESMVAYNNATVLFSERDGHGHSAPRKYLTFRSLCYLAKALGRQITEEDLKILLKDEGLKFCYVRKEKRRAISWIFLGKETVEKIESLTKKGMSLETIVSKQLSFSGPFYFKNEKIKRFDFFSGALFPERKEFSPLRNKINTQQKCGIDSHTAIRIANKRY